jgi:hypothetical protein
MRTIKVVYIIRLLRENRQSTTAHATVRTINGNTATYPIKRAYCYQKNQRNRIVQNENTREFLLLFQL